MRFEMNGGRLASYATVVALMTLINDAVLDGALQMQLAPGQTVELGDKLQLLAYRDGPCEFSNLLSPGLLGELTWNAEYGSTLLAVEAILQGNLTGDRIVDGADLLAWQRADSSRDR